jgi:uncharacterized protein YjbJ (UPF0337 family)
VTQQEGPGRSGGLFEKVAGKAKEAVGSLIGNDDLASEGRLQQTKAEKAAEAERLAAQAEQADEQAEVAAAAETNRIEQQRVNGELAERERLQQIERDKTAAQAEVERNAQRREAVIERQAEAEEAVIERHEVDAVAERIDGQVEAAEIAQEAKRAAAAAEALDAAQRELERQQTGG